ncbi:MAG: DUF4168 domain-containing protein [Deltaproteobacteria bacterium]|nr:DUF4168 domain-containing protein [Deltaproteobacteria bacterium]MBI2229409.1 DUF4168 domain-containing protein [Deltaproteobacteria bacterium]MBI2365593.1 DUF4168 domain-containing protein [Deltaproteobacteria bacterium]MBI2533737.1 DUF4168 domain-containing protein [Deltaproteobacteria bacterium]
MKNFFVRNAFPAALIGLVSFSFPPFTHAQDLPKQSQSAEPTKLSDKDLRAFAKAYVAYQKLRQTYEPRLNRAQDPKEKEQIQREGDFKVKEALEKHGFTPQSYNRLFAAVNGNEQLRQKALKLINEERSRS